MYRLTSSGLRLQSHSAANQNWSDEPWGQYSSSAFGIECRILVILWLIPNSPVHSAHVWIAVQTYVVLRRLTRDRKISGCIAQCFWVWGLVVIYFSLFHRIFRFSGGSSMTERHNVLRRSRQVNNFVLYHVG